MVRVHAVARGQHLVDQSLRALSFLFGHAAIPGGRGGAHNRSAAPERLLGLARKRAEAHAGDRNRNLEMDRLLGEARAEYHVGRAFLPVAFERIATDRGTKKQKIVEMGDFALRPETPDVVDAGRSGAVDLGDRMLVEGRGVTRRRMHPAGFGPHQYASRLSMWKW